MEPPPLPHFAYLPQKDDEHLKLLAVFHFIVGGFSLVIIGFLVMHFMIMKQVFMNPSMWKGSGGPAHAPPAEVFQIFIWFYVVAGVLVVLSGVANVLSGLFLQRKKYRTFSLVVAGTNCLHFPFGTVLGIFTLLVLLRESVRQSYERENAVPMRF
ncbi:hypothetical protein JIN84_01525 [Luteolibacter yonseiensis]|uniref:Uncharacterized protein n=1 Tax=Luteolibacter yonseiensis TaxID=1144680 RepID=A0A934R181_9BACT|nr:hypothetical protein [Luteolibacter yonseiensis]MBK1814288.1 hypothetical protein [Luteolibacter yonseiensis]